jgi:Carboxypeptidase regulatory-like domain/TonB dependent receptor
MKRLVCIFAFAAGLFGQTADLGILGTVTDQSGSVIVGAAVTIVGPAIGFNKTVTTGTDGHYELRFLLPETYNVEVHMNGFRPEITSGVTLVIGQLARVDFKLQVGSLAEEVQVSAQGVLLDTQTATMAQTVTSERVVDLPINGRSYVGLGNLVPGVQASGTSFQSNGARSFYEQISYDGTNVLQQRSNNGAPSPIIDAISEFKIQTGNYSAEYGGNAGANVQVQIKSGTNQIHGGAWDFLQNSDLDARGTFKPAPQPKNILKQNMFGGILSGPIRKDKTFIMMAYEGTRAIAQTPSSSLVFTPAQLAGNFTGFKTILDPTNIGANGLGMAFPNNIIPTSRLNPVSEAIASTYFPQPNVASTVANISGVSQTNTTNDQAMTRVDEMLRANDQIFGHYIYYNSLTPNVGLAGPLFETLPHSRNQSIAVQWLHTFSPTKINMVEFGYDRALATELSSRAGTSFNAVSTLGINGMLVGGPGGTALTGVNAGFPSIAVSGYLGIGDSTGGAGLDGSHTHQVMDVFTMIKGAHTLKMGVDVRRLADNANTTNQPYGTMSFTGSVSGNAAADYVLGYPGTTVSPQGIPVSGVRAWRYGFFFNDDWKVSNKLTINLGARYDLLPVPYDAVGTSRTLVWPTNALPVFACSGEFPVVGNCAASSTPTLWPNPGQTVPLWKNEYWHIGPRVGLAYRITGNNVFRAGYGIFTVTPNFDQVNTLQNNPPIGANFTAVNTIQNPVATIQNPFPAVLISSGGTPTYNYVSEEPGQHHINPYFQNWNAQIGHEFTKTDVLEVRYVGGKGTFLDSSLLDYNNPPPGFLGAIQPRRPFPTLGEIRMWVSDGNSNYNAQQVQYEHRFGHGLSTTASYSYSHLIDDQGGNLNGTRAQSEDPRCDRCNMRAGSENDIRNRFIVGYTWRIPVGERMSRGFLGAVFSGWDFSGILTEQDGNPMFITVSGDPGNDDANSSGYLETRPSLVPGQNIHVATQSTGQWFNQAAFVSPGGSYGNAPRSLLTAPGKHTLDASFSKSFKMPYKETHHILFRLEAFNSTNTPNWSAPGTSLGTSAFGIITAAGANRVVQSALKYSF